MLIYFCLVSMRISHVGDLFIVMENYCNYTFCKRSTNAILMPVVSSPRFSSSAFKSHTLRSEIFLPTQSDDIFFYFNVVAAAAAAAVFNQTGIGQKNTLCNSPDTKGNMVWFLLLEYFLFVGESCWLPMITKLLLNFYLNFQVNLDHNCFFFLSFSSCANSLSDLFTWSCVVHSPYSKLQLNTVGNMVIDVFVFQCC